MRLMVIGGLLVLFGLLAGGEGQQSTAPEIIFIDFPKQIQADGTKVSGFVGFKDADGDLVRAGFSVVQAKDLQPFTIDLKMLKGIKEGVFEFQIATKTPQQATLRVVLADEAGNRSQPEEFSFEAVVPGQPPPPAQNPVLQVSPTSLSFSTEVGRNPPSQTIQITNAGSGTLSWSASADQPWIGLNPSSGIAPSTVTVSINAAGLAAGSYSGRITIAAPGAQGSPVTVLASLTLSAPQRPAVLEVNPARLDFQGYEGGNDPATQLITIRNTGGQPLSWTAQADANWVKVGLSRGELQPGTSQSVTVSVRLARLSAGDRQAGIIITAPGAQGSPVRVVVTLRVKSRLVRSLTGHTDGVNSVAFSPDGKLLASGSCGKKQDSACIQGEIKLWDVTIGFEVRTISGHTGYVNSVAFSPDGRLLASGSDDKMIKLWEVATGTEVRTLIGHTSRVTSVAFSPDGRLLASGSWDKTIKLWDVVTGNEVTTLSGHIGAVSSVAFSLDGKLLASASGDKTIKLWDISDLTGR